MKFKSFDIEDVLNVNDAEIAKTSFINLNGYFANTLESLDNLEFFGTLSSVSKTTPFAYYCRGDTNFKYFLPLGKVKRKEYTCDFKTEPTEKDINYRPCKNLIELMDLLDKEKHEDCLVGTTIYIRHKLKTRMIETSIITSAKRDGDDNWLLCLGDKFYSLVELFNHYDILLNGRYQPFGVKENEQ